MSLNLTKRQAHIGSSMKSKTQTDGEEKIPTVEIVLSGLMLDKDELNELLDDKYAHNALFDTKGKLHEPMFKQLRAFVLRDKFEKSMVRFYLGLTNETIELKGCKLSKLHIEPTTGGLTELTLQVHCSPDADQMGKLFTAQDSNQSVSIRFGAAEKKKKDQPELPLEGRTKPDSQPTVQ